MKKKLLTTQSIKDGYIYICRLDGINYADIVAQFSKLKTYIYTNIEETWGHTELIPKKLTLEDIFIRNNFQFYYFYLYFKSTDSVLQVKLAKNINISPVNIYPTNSFTVHEYS